MTEAYAQSGWSSVQSNQEIAASSTDESSVKVTDSGTFSLSDSTIRKTGEISSLDVWVALM